MKAGAKRTARIELRLREVAQLFNSLDPSPFNDRDLDADAEEFIVNWAREHPKDREFELTLFLTVPPADSKLAVEEAVGHYFATRAQVKRQQFRQGLKRGRNYLMVGLAFVAVCFSLGEVVASLLREPWTGFVKEGITILGWVALWRPLEFYLYDRWRLRDEPLLLERLARMRVNVMLP
jgi:hypothetical protein